MGIASSNYRLPDPFSKLYCESLCPFPIKSHILSSILNRHPVIYRGKKEESPLAYIESRNVVIDSIKESINGKGIVVRLYEALGFRTADNLTLSFPYKKVEECNLVEEDRRKLRSLRLEFSPFEIKTLYFTRSQKKEENILSSFLLQTLFPSMKVASTLPFSSTTLKSAT